MKLTHIFNMPSNIKITDYCTNSNRILSTGQHKIIRIYEELFVESVESSFPIILRSFKVII